MENKPENNESSQKVDMKTLSSCVNHLTRQGYEAQFKVTKDGLKSLATEKVYRPDEVKIASFYRFEGDSDPADNSILYAIETGSGEKGTLSDAYGIYNDANVSAFIKEVEDCAKKAH